MFGSISAEDAAGISAISAAVSAFATGVLISLTAWYIWLCRRQASAAERSASSAADATKATEATVRAQLWLEAQRIVRLDEFYKARKQVMEQERPVRVHEWKDGKELRKNNLSNFTA